MTEELKQKAKEYLKAQCLKRKDCLVLEMPDHYITDVRQAYIDGATENGIQWHDLRKNPKDLPKGYRVVLNQVGAPTNYDPKRGFLGFGGIGIIAWCEIPLFKE